MAETNFKQTLSLHIRSKYPVIWLCSFEEGRTLRILNEIAEEQQKKVITWACTQGFMEGEKVIQKDAADLGTAFEVISQMAKTGQKIIYVFKDLHRFLLEPDKVAYRLLRDVEEQIKGSFITLVVLAPIVKYPQELEKTITVLDVPYPDEAELQVVMDKLIKATKEAGADIKEPANGEYEVILRAAKGLTEDEWENVVAMSLVSKKYVDPVLITKQKEQMIRKSGVVDLFQSVEGLENVGGCDEVKDWIKRRSITFSAKAREFGLLPPKGIFLGGVTGCGKSLLAKAAASYLKVPLLVAQTSKILNKYLGESEQNLAKVFALAEAVSPAILFFDEAEKFFNSDASGDGNASRDMFGMFLTWMQECIKPVLVCMTTNDPLKLPPELFTRFDATFFVDLPVQGERIEVFNVQLRKIKRDPKDFTVLALAMASEQWSGREIEKAIGEALARAFERKQEITTETILEVLKERVPIAIQRKADINKMREWGKDKALPASRKSIQTSSGSRKLEV